METPRIKRRSFTVSFTKDSAHIQNGKRDSKKIPLRWNEGLSFVKEQEIAEIFSKEKFQPRHMFSYARPIFTEVEVNVPDEYFVFSSFAETESGLKPRKASQFVIGIADKKKWNRYTLQHRDTSFQLIVPKKRPHIEVDVWKKYIPKIWDKMISLFGSASDHVVIVDLEGPISGGPVGENVFGIFATDQMTSMFQKDIKANLGWEPKHSTRAYVLEEYSEAQDPWMDYLVGTFSHELMHLYFGFGLTRQDVQYADELWFSLGMGMIYDMEITSEIMGRPPRLEVDVMRNWKENVSSISSLDQRLISPDRSKDHDFPYDRKKIFAHGKAAYFLSALRQKIGKENFDGRVKDYLKCSDCERGYEDFRKYLSGYENILSNLEREFQVKE